MTLFYILFFTFLGSVVSLIGGVLLLAKEKLALKFSHYLLAFAAGVLLGAAFLDLLPEAGEMSQMAVIGVLAFFLIERFVHHHQKHDGEGKQIVSLIVVGDSVHNFIDGVAIAASFLVSVPLGITTTIAVAAHEIPQEIADFGLMLHQGVKKNKILLINFFSALTAMMGAVLTFVAQEQIEGFLPAILGLTAGFFIYIAASDLIPEIHNEDRKNVALAETILLLGGVLIIYLAVWFIEGMVPHDS